MLFIPQTGWWPIFLPSWFEEGWMTAFFAVRRGGYVF